MKALNEVSSGQVDCSVAEATFVCSTSVTTLEVLRTGLIVPPVKGDSKFGNIVFGPELQKAQAKNNHLTSTYYFIYRCCLGRCEVPTQNLRRVASLVKTLKAWMAICVTTLNL